MQYMQLIAALLLKGYIIVSPPSQEGTAAPVVYEKQETGQGSPKVSNLALAFT